ncbi:MAG: hypothetical protein MUE46_09825 [Xanthomonadales bacterium]|jgi:hypothetical protein|nr:hypothetical protein [Xanthomonadales bacterium]
MAIAIGSGFSAGLLAPGAAVAQGYRTVTTTEIIRTERRVIVPQRHRRWSEPPRGARRVHGRYWNPSWSWKSDPHTRTVFVVTPSRELWFLDPTTGWAYTIDRWGRVYTADPRARWVYYVGPVHAWQGDLPYFFSHWEPHNGYYRVPRFDSFSVYYGSSRYRGYDYAYAYDTLWGFERWFYSPSFSRVTAFRHYDPYYLSWRGYYRDTYVDARGRYWWEPDPVTIWRRPSLYRNISFVQPIYSVRPWQRGLPETARLSSERLAGEMGVARGRDVGGPGQRPGRDTVGFNVPLSEVPREPDFGYSRDIRVADSERSLPQFADPGKPVPAVLAAAPVVNPMSGASPEVMQQLPTLPGADPVDTRPAPGFDARPDSSARGIPTYEASGQKPAGGYAERPAAGIGSPTVIENVPEFRANDRGRSAGFSDPVQVEPPPSRFEEAPRFDPPPQRFEEPRRIEEPQRFRDEAPAFRDEAPAFKEPQRFDPPPQRFEEPQRFDPPPQRFEEPQRFDPPPQRFEEPQRFDPPPQRFEEPQRFDPPPQRFEEPQRFEVPASRGRDRDEGRELRSFSSDEEGGGWPR